MSEETISDGDLVDAAEQARGGYALENGHKYFNREAYIAGLRAVYELGVTNGKRYRAKNQ